MWVTKVEDRNGLITIESCSAWNSKVIKKKYYISMLSLSVARNKKSAWIALREINPLTPACAIRQGRMLVCKGCCQAPDSLHHFELFFLGVGFACRLFPKHWRLPFYWLSNTSRMSLISYRPRENSQVVSLVQVRSYICSWTRHSLRWIEPGSCVHSFPSIRLHLTNNNNLRVRERCLCELHERKK